ncbi:MAG: diacylglycerol O-acyltransferase / wax synthase [Actinomycetota bacterium]|nr:diacylglycerol O-acyltransferase / wax synthase [Actinomycetota bacterium]
MPELEPRMGAFSAVIWDIEGDPILRSPITLVCMLDSAPDVDVVIDRLERMTRMNPKLRARVIGNPVSLVPPRWEVDPNFDMSFHVRWERPERPRADLSDVLTMAERITEEDFDRSRPLWELHIVTGLKGKQAAFIMKVHHSITDGEGGVLMLAMLFEMQRTPATDLGPMPDAPTGSVLDQAQRLEQGSVAGAKAFIADAKNVTVGSVGLVKDAVTAPMASAVSAKNWTASAARLLAPASEPLSDLWTGRSMSVSFAVLEASLADVKAAAKAAQATLNDVFMAAVVGGLSRYHREHGSESTALRVNMPVSMRAQEGSGDGNSWVPARFEIPIGEASAEDRITGLHPLLLQARTEPALGMSGAVYRALSLLPNPAMAAASSGLMKGTDFAATNVPGPPIPLYFAGTQVLSMVPFAPKGGAAVNIGLMSYDGKVFIGINTDPGAVADPYQLVDNLYDSLQEVLAVGNPDPID